MTFNVEEYWHDFDNRFFMNQICQIFAQRQITDLQVRDWFTRLKEHVQSKIALVRSIIEQHKPDIFCLEEHSMALDPEVLKKSQVMKCLTPEQLFTHEDIIAWLLPEDYDHCVKETGESIAKFSELANLVAWKRSKFERVATCTTSGTYITEKYKPVPGRRSSCYTPRSVACVELQPLRGGTSFIVCATHLLGGRFEDSIWAEDHEAGANERVNQVMAIQKFIESYMFTAGVPSIIAGDFNVMRQGFISGPFAQGSRKYVIGNTMLYSRHKLEKDYRERYVPYQNAVHVKLEELGYTAAYGQSDDLPQMKTSKHGGCIDWIYIKGLSSKKDEKIIETNMMERSGASDHNAVLITLSTSPPRAHIRTWTGAGPSVASLILPKMRKVDQPPTRQILDLLHESDINNDGTIDKDRLERIFKKIDPILFTDSNISALFELADMQECKQIPTEDFVSWLMSPSV